jgi:hypothetical protein
MSCNSSYTRFILKEPFEDQKYLGTHFKYKIKITLG